MEQGEYAIVGLKYLRSFPRPIPSSLDPADLSARWSLWVYRWVCLVKPSPPARRTK